MPRSTPIEDVVLAELVKALVESLAVRRIVLFGSRAAGAQVAVSDYDLIVVADTSLPVDERAYLARKATRDFGVPLDLLVYTPEEYAKLLRWRSSAVAIAEAEGRVLYEAA